MWYSRQLASSTCTSCHGLKSALCAPQLHPLAGVADAAYSCSDPAHVAALEVACLRCLSELVALCRRSKVLPQHLSDIQAVMLDNLRVRDRGEPLTDEGCRCRGMQQQQCAGRAHARSYVTLTVTHVVMHLQTCTTLY
jgi:hypothetical protein